MEIELIPWTLAQRADLIRISNAADRTYLTGRMPYPYETRHADWWLNMIREHEGRDGVFRAICVDGQIVGNITVEGKSDIYCKDAEIGYHLLKPYHGKGIMTEAARQICEIAFDTLEIIRISSLVVAPNMGSRRVLEKNGFELEGMMRRAVFKNGSVHDLCLYGKLK